MCDLSELTPAPWIAEVGRVGDVAFGDDDEEAIVLQDDDSDGRDGRHIALMFSDAMVDAAFIVLARNAFDVMMRRRWYAIPSLHGKWIVAATTVMDNPYDHGAALVDVPFYDDPFTALVEADKWYKENVEIES